MSAISHARRFWDQPEIYSAALGCSTCPLNQTCGGIHSKSSIFDCHDFCCGRSSGCTTVCRHNPAFLEQFCEVGGFTFDPLPLVRAPDLHMRSAIVPLIYHAAGREEVFKAPRVCLRLRDVLDLQLGQARFSDRDALCEAFQILPETEIIVSGIDHDPQVEAVWKLGNSRPAAFRALAKLGFTAVTTPNFSLILDRPRGDNLHSMKRISILYNEMAEAGLPVALHPNARTEYDMQRWWTEFIQPRPWITAIAYEFGTGSGVKGRIEAHCEWLSRIARQRPMAIVIRGNPQAIELLDDFQDVTYIESTSFLKAVNRQWPSRTNNRQIEWATHESPTFDTHLSKAVTEVGDILRSRHFSKRL